MSADPRFNPEVGDRAVSKSGVPYRIIKIDCHINSDDISYIRIRSDKDRERSVILLEWGQNFKHHERPA